MISAPGHRCNLPNIPNFNPSVHGKLPFSMISKDSQSSSVDQAESMKKSERYINKVGVTLTLIELREEGACSTPVYIWLKVWEKIKKKTEENHTYCIRP